MPTETPVKERSNAYTRARARQLRERGLTLKAIAAELDLSSSTVGTYLERQRRRPDAVCPKLFLRFLEPYVSEGEDGIRINGRPLDEKQTRALFRWRHEDVAPTYSAVDRFLLAVGLLISSDFEAWAEQEGECIWFAGKPPAGYRESDNHWWLDLEAPYARGENLAPLEERQLWQQDALEEAARHNYELPPDVILSTKTERLLAACRRKQQAHRKQPARRIRASISAAA